MKTPRQQDKKENSPRQSSNNSYRDSSCCFFFPGSLENSGSNDSPLVTAAVIGGIAATGAVAGAYADSANSAKKHVTTCGKVTPYVTTTLFLAAGLAGGYFGAKDLLEDKALSENMQRTVIALITVFSGGIGSLIPSGARAIKKLCCPNWSLFKQETSDGARTPKDDIERGYYNQL
jgi:hypothetical protein